MPNRLAVGICYYFLFSLRLLFLTCQDNSHSSELSAFVLLLSLQHTAVVSFHLLLHQSFQASEKHCQTLFPLLYEWLKQKLFLHFHL